MGTIGTIPLIRRVGLVVFLCLAYLGVWRELRVVAVSQGVFPVAQSIRSQHSGITLTLKRGAAIVAQKSETTAQYAFSGFGNSFFLLGAVYFLAVGLGWKPVFQLFLIHQGITLLSLLSLFLAVSTHPAWLYPMNFLVKYFVPAATAMFVLTTKSRP